MADLKNSTKIYRNKKIGDQKAILFTTADKPAMHWLSFYGE